MSCILYNAFRSTAIKHIFKTGPAAGLRAILLGALALMLIMLDHRSAYFHRIRSELSVVAAPFQMLVDAPIKWVHWLGTSVTAQRHLLEDNARLRAHELLLESKLQKLLALERENAQLRELLKSTTEVAGRVIVAQLLAVDLDPSLQQIVLDKGSRKHVYVGQPVLDAYGVMGQVINVGPLTSKILLATDTRSAVPVQDYRNSIRSVAVGLGASGKLALINVPNTSDIKVGDLFVTSGLGLRFPVGYPVGSVSKVEHVPGRRFAVITLIPAAHLDQTRQVLLVWPSKVSLVKAVRKQLNKTISSIVSVHKREKK